MFSFCCLPRAKIDPFVHPTAFAHLLQKVRGSGPPDYPVQNCCAYITLGAESKTAPWGAVFR